MVKKYGLKIIVLKIPFAAGHEEAGADVHEREAEGLLRVVEALLVDGLRRLLLHRGSQETQPPNFLQQSNHECLLTHMK
jgi:hypothetical protein